MNMAVTKTKRGVGLTEATVLSAEAWAARIILSTTTSTPRRSVRRCSIRNELMQHRA